MAHDVEPLLGRGFSVAVQQLADAVDENLGASARHAVEARGDQPTEDGWNGQLRQPRQVNDLWRRQRVQLEPGITLLDRAEQIFVPGEGQIGIVSALQQQLHAADGDGLVDFSEQLVEAQHVAFG